MDKPVRRGKLEDVPNERRLLYESYYRATWQRVQTKAVSLVQTHESHRRHGSCAVDHDVDEVINQGFIRVLLDPKDCPTADAFTLDMFRQMEGFLTEQRRLAGANRDRHEPIDDLNPQRPSVIVMPVPTLDVVFEQRKLLAAARDAVARLQPQWLQLFDLSLQNLSNDQIAEITGRSPKLLNSDRHRLHAFLKSYFTSGEQP